MSLAGAVTALHALFCDDPDLGRPRSELEPYVDRIWRREPRPGDAAGPIAVTVRSTGMDALNYGVAVAVYAMCDPDPIWAADQVDDIAQVIESILDDEGIEYERGAWRIEYAQTLDVIVADLQMTTGRTDF